MPIAFVLVTCASGKETGVRDEIEGLDGITELHPLFGEWDLMIKIEKGDIESLSSFIIHRIRSIDGVVSTKTLTSAFF